MARDSKDPYQILGVRPTASQEEIRRAYRRLAKDLHPDRNPHSEQARLRFSELTNAYDLLSDPTRRREYDGLLRSMWRQIMTLGRNDQRPENRDLNPPPVRPAQPAIRPEPQVIRRDFERPQSATSRPEPAPQPQPIAASAPEPVTSPAPAPPRIPPLASHEPPSQPQPKAAPPLHAPDPSPPRPGSDITLNIEIPFITAAQGGPYEVALKVDRLCPVCDGAGCQPGTRCPECPECLGTGTLTDGRVCQRCLGRGYLVESPCTHCGGAGSIEESRPYRLIIPPLMPEPHEVILEGEGEPGWAGAPPGDLVLLLRWQPHPTFQRRGPHLFSRVAVNFAQLIYGDTLEVETMRGFMAITIPAATAPGSMIVLREFGLPIPADSAAPQAPYGDHFIALDMQMPNVSRQEDARRLHSFCKSLGMLDRMKNPPPPPTASSRATKTSTNSFPHKNP